MDGERSMGICKFILIDDAEEFQIGSIDNSETRSLCCEILEGGERAFRKRQAIYHI
nr:hypothetical protein [uncultured Prevotella sp.]